MCPKDMTEVELVPLTEERISEIVEYATGQTDKLPSKRQ